MAALLLGFVPVLVVPLLEFRCLPAGRVEDDFDLLDADVWLEETVSKVSRARHSATL